MVPAAEPRIDLSRRPTGARVRPYVASRQPARLARVAAVLILMAAAAGAAVPVRAQGLAPAAERGRALYDTRCIACHDRSVHRRESRRASDFAALRAEVSRWSETAGGEWKAEELDAVAAYLNERYYRYPCPPAVCRGPDRAGAR